jgi:hypothetical protein
LSDGGLDLLLEVEGDGEEGEGKVADEDRFDDLCREERVSKWRRAVSKAKKTRRTEERGRLE